MRIGLLESIERLRTGLDYHLARQNVLVSNLAHLDTPGYRPLDVERTTNSTESFQVHLQATIEGHADPGATARAATHPAFRVIEDPSAPNGYDGNRVSLDREVVKVSTNQMRYDTIAQLASSQLQNLNWAVNDGKNG